MEGDPTSRRYRRSGLTWRLYRALSTDAFPLSAGDLARKVSATKANVETALVKGEGVWFERDADRERLWTALFVEVLSEGQ